MAVPSDAEQTEVPNRFFRTIEIGLTRMHESPQYAEHLHDHKRGRVGTEVFQVETLLNPGPERRLEQKLVVADASTTDHADSRSRWMILGTGVFNFTRERPWSRASISSRAGGAAIRSTSASRSSKSVMPEWAARGFDRPHRQRFVSDPLRLQAARPHVSRSRVSHFFHTWPEREAV
jgi:hypothetical protein